MVLHDNARGPSLSRRALLGAVGSGCLAAILAGCESAAPLPEGDGRVRLGDNRPLPVPRQVSPPAAVVVPQASTYGIIPRSAWARAGPAANKLEPMNGVSRITFHHSGDPHPFSTTDYAQTAQHLEDIREDHHNNRRWADIGYHFAIDRAGRVWQLRSLAYQGSHVESHNEHNVGIVVLGNFDLQSMSAAQKEKVQTFGRLVRRQYALSIAQIKTHQEIRKTECPGDEMQPFMVAVRNKGMI